MKHVYFTRHGQTVWNVENKICGATDIELTELGHNQAIELGKEIASGKIKIDEILYSPLVRAAETARHISEETGIPRRVEMIFMAFFNAPPVTVVIMSIIANKPLKVLLSLSAVSSLITRVDVNL